MQDYGQVRIPVREYDAAETPIDGLARQEDAVVGCGGNRKTHFDAANRPFDPHAARREPDEPDAAVRARIGRAASQVRDLAIKTR